MNENLELSQTPKVGAVVGDSRKITLPSGRVVEVYLCKVRHVGRIARILVGVLSVISEMQGKGGGSAGIDFEAAMGDNTLLLRLFSSVADDMYLLVSLLSDVPYDEVLNLNIDDALVLLSEVMKDNYSFFMERVVPLVPSLLPKLDKQ